MKPEERALLQERVKTLVLGHALQAALERLGGTAHAAGRDAAADLAGLEETLLAAARGLADRAVVQKLAVLVAVEDVSATLRAAFASALAQIAEIRGAEAEAAAALAA